MEKVILFLGIVCSCSLLTAQVKFKSLHVTPEFPKPGETVNFEYSPSNTLLGAEKEIEAVVYMLNSKGLKVAEPTLTKNGNNYTGSFLTDSNTSCLAFKFSSASQIDNNAGKGFYIPLYNQQGQPLLASYITLSQLYRGYGEYLCKTIIEPAKALSTLEAGLMAYPSAKEDEEYLPLYLHAIHTAKKAEAEPLIMARVMSIEAKQVISEQDYDKLIHWYSLLKQKAASDSIAALRNEHFPQGAWAKPAALDKIYGGKSAAEKKKNFDEYLAMYPPTEEDKFMIQMRQAILLMPIHGRKIILNSID